MALARSDHSIERLAAERRVSPIVLIDNYDSFTYNLADLIATATGVYPAILLNDAMSWEDLAAFEFEWIVVSPGPGTPACPADVGISAEAIRHARVPLLGVCLGHQAIGLHYGATVSRACRPVHGRVDSISHAGDSMFDDVPRTFDAVRYHSLAVTDLPACLEATAWASDGTLMALRHTQRPQWGVQFHPESICSRFGDTLLRNFFASSSGVPRRATQAWRTTNENAADTVSIIRFHAHAELLPASIDASMAFDAVYARSQHAFWLDSSSCATTAGLYSYMGDAAGPYAEVVEYRAHSSSCAVTSGSARHIEAVSIFDYLEQQLECRQMAPADLPFDFTGGYLGYFGYELKSELWGTEHRRGTVPDAVWLFVDRFLVFDHSQNRIWAVCLDHSEHPMQTTREWLRSTIATLAAVRRSEPPDTVEPRGDRDEPRLVASRASSREYKALVVRALTKLRDGDSYEICLTNELTIRSARSAISLYRDIRLHNPVPYGAYLQLGEVAILCGSPESFLRIDANRCITSKPIKGTVARREDPEEDRAAAEELVQSDKNRAENLMIVDLVRNDLGRVCKPGSVAVPTLFAVESYSSVHHLVSTITGQLQDGVSSVDCVTAAFPGGSMTGAPKIRTMQILDQLESGPRGIYSGSLGYLSLNGTASLNIVIRTLVQTGDTATLGTGGAIIALSDPDAELDEMALKAASILRPLGAWDDARIFGSEPGFELFETILWCQDYRLIDYHMDRMQSSAMHFEFAFDRSLVLRQLRDLARGFEAAKSYRVRVTHAASGRTSFEAGEFVAGDSRGLVTLSVERCASDDVFKQHKTTVRAVYDRLYAEASAQGFDDVLFLNERDEVTEGAISNVIVEKNGRWLTPPLDCGVLPGVFRRHVLKTVAHAEEKILHQADLESADALFICNALRGLRRVHLRRSDDSHRGVGL